MKAPTSDFPEDWPLQRLGEIFAFSNGVNAEKSSYGKGCRFINVLETITFSHLHGPEIPGRVSLPETVVDTYVVRTGDILFNRTSETDADVGMASVYLGSERVVFGGFVIRGRPVEEVFDPAYAGYALRAPFIRSQVISMGQGAVRSNIGQESLKRVLAPVPPVAEQRGIAKALSDVDALLAGLDRLIAKKRSLKTAVMRQLLGGSARLPGFQAEWEIATFADVVQHHAGNSTLIKGKLSQSKRRGLYPAYSASGQDVWCDHYEHEGDAIVVSAVGSRCGKAFAATGKWSAIANTHVVWPRQDVVDLRFLSFFINDENFWLKSGTGQPFVLFSQSFARPLKLPSVHEQSSIATFLTDMDAELSALDAKRVKTRALKQAMMQELLTGLIRLI